MSLDSSRALWNRSKLDLRSDEVIAQILDRGAMEDWRELYQLARSSDELRHRIATIVRRVPVPLPHFWLAALANLGEPIDFDQELPRYGEHGP